MSNANGVNTPTTGDPVGADLGGPALSEKWEYRSISGMLMYLAANTHPDIAYSVHQAARFSHNLKNNRALAIKHILRFLKKTHDKGMYMHPDGSFKLSCYVDSDFVGLFESEDPGNPVSVKSRIGYIIKFGNVPILWVSKLQTQIALSTMEAEYIALYQSMRALIPL